MKKIFYFAAAAAVTAAFAWSQNQMPAGQKLRIAEAAIAELYVDSVNEDKLVEDAIRGMLNELDPHSAYSNAEETREMNEPLNGNFSGIGITFNMNKDTLYVIQTINGGPSERVGMLAGDRIIAVNDTSIAGMKMKNSDIMKRLRGPKGTDVNVKVLRRFEGKSDTINFKITRADIPINSMDAAYMVDSVTGYIRLNKFAAETIKEFAQGIKDLKAQGMKNLILDLVDNGGGYLNAATDILSELLPEKSLTVYTEGLNSPRYDHLAFSRGLEPLFTDGRIVVMTNQYSASSAEITSGAIQDWDRGVIVGRRTFGKGLVQRPIPFPDGSMIRLTVAHYYTPTGRDIQKPYTKGKSDKYREDILDRLHSGELMHADSIKYVDSLKVKTLRLGRTIYGGGGISPDRFVPLDTTEFSKYYRDVVAKGVLNQYVIKYVEQNRKKLLKQYPTDTDFVEKFEVTPEMLSDLYALAEKEGVAPNPEEAATSVNLFKMNVKGLIGRDTYDQATYHKVFNQYDPIFKEAYRVITTDEYDEILSKPKKKRKK